HCRSPQRTPGGREMGNGKGGRKSEEGERGQGKGEGGRGKGGGGRGKGGGGRGKGKGEGGRGKVEGERGEGGGGKGKGIVSCNVYDESCPYHGYVMFSHLKRIQSSKASLSDCERNFVPCY
ncbi:unnamed protein product, partial [Closterium sp. NIES-54]